MPIGADETEGTRSLKYGTIVDVHERVVPGRILVRNSFEPDDSYIAFTSATSGDDLDKLSVVIGSERNSGVQYTYAISYPAWDVTDFVEIRPDFSAGKFRDSKRLAHGDLFLTPDGEFAVFGRTTNPREPITTLVATGALVVLKGEVMMFPKWRLAILDNTGKEIGHFDPEVFRRPSSSIATA